MDRALATLLLLWFAIVSAEPALVHSCPMHDGAGAARTAVAAAHGGDAVGHDGHHAPDDKGRHRACTCLGECSPGAAAPAVPAARLGLVVATITQPRAELPTAGVRACVGPRFLLPYANGPPAGDLVA
jgi:hypothetical protein